MAQRVGVSGVPSLGLCPTDGFIHLLLRQPRISSAGLPPKGAHDPSPGGSATTRALRTGTPTTCPSRIVDTHRTLYLSTRRCGGRVCGSRDECDHVVGTDDQSAQRPHLRHSGRRARFLFRVRAADLNVGRGKTITRRTVICEQLRRRSAVGVHPGLRRGGLTARRRSVGGPVLRACEDRIGALDSLPRALTRGGAFLTPPFLAAKRWKERLTLGSLLCSCDTRSPPHWPTHRPV